MCHSFSVCFRIFDSDEDGLLSKEELTRATSVLHRIKRENGGDNSGSREVNGEPPVTVTEGAMERGDIRADEKQQEVGRLGI